MDGDDARDRARVGRRSVEHFAAHLKGHLRHNRRGAEVDRPAVPHGHLPPRCRGNVRYYCTAVQCKLRLARMDVP